MSAWEKYEENLVRNFPINYENKKKDWTALQVCIFCTCPVFCCWTLLSAFSWIPGRYDSSLERNSNVVMLTYSYFHSPSFFRSNISFAMGLTKSVCLPQPNSQRRKHWRYVQSSQVSISWLSFTKQVVASKQTIGNYCESFPNTQRSLWLLQKSL